METTFTPVAGLVGGALIGLASAGLLLAEGRIAGISGILGRSLFGTRGDVAWRVAFLVGLPLGAAAVTRATGDAAGFAITSQPLVLIAGGLLVGVGTQLGNGCTSGHGVCGLARGSRRSLAATLVFMATAALAVFVVRHVLAGGGVKNAVALVCGVVFGAGLAVSGMTNPAKVLAFLDVAGAWDPTLGLVMGAALAVSRAGTVWARRRERPRLGGRFAWPTRRDLDPPLLAGAALFGIGWGLVGLCPGPALANLHRGSLPVGLFVTALVAGTVAFRGLSRLSPRALGAAGR